jgi:hypothetical protein
VSITWFSDILKAIDLRARFLFGAAFLGVVALSFPDVFPFAKSGAEFRPWIILGTLASLTVALIKAYDPAARPVHESRRRNAVIADLGKLSEWELEALLGSVDRGTRSLSHNDNLGIRGLPAPLVARGILERAEGRPRSAVDTYVIPAFVWQHLKDNEARYRDRLAELTAKRKAKERAT